MRETREGRGRMLKSAVLWMDQRRLLGLTRFILAVLLFAIPAAADFSVLTAWGWWIGAVACAIIFGVLEFYQARLDGTTLDRVTNRIAAIQGAFAGGLNDIRSAVIESRGRRLSHEQCRSLCVGFLHGVRDYAAAAFQVASRPHLRATLLVPVQDPATGQVVALKVWAYHESPLGRRNTEVPLRVNGIVVPGAPRAYVRREVDFITDVHDVTEVPGSPQRPYRAIVSFPLDASDPTTGDPLAVVCIDADEPGFFDGETTLGKPYPLIAPALNALGLVLALRNRGRGYEFPA